MKGFFLTCCFVLSATFVFGQTGFPNNFVGHWKGTLSWYQTGKADAKQVAMQLIIAVTDTPSVYTWQIIYGEGGEDNRLYLLKPGDTSKGHWQIDERNGILIDQYFIGGRFTSAFTVQASTIIDSYRREGDSLIAEFYSITAKPTTTTGLGTDDSPKVDSYATKSYQRAVMHRVK